MGWVERGAEELFASPPLVLTPETGTHTHIETWHQFKTAKLEVSLRSVSLMPSLRAGPR